MTGLSWYAAGALLALHVHSQTRPAKTFSHTDSLPIGTRALMPGHLSAKAPQMVGPCIAGHHYCTWLDGTSASTSHSSSSAPGSSEALALRLPADRIALALRLSAGTCALAVRCNFNRQIVQFTLQHCAAACIQDVVKAQTD